MPRRHLLAALWCTLLVVGTSARGDVAVVRSEDDDRIQHPEARPDGSTPEWRPAYYSEDNLLDLTTESFPSARAEFPRMLVTFYAPWCVCSAQCH